MPLLTRGALAGLALAALTASAQPERPFLHALFTDHMVLQREAACPVWGWTAPGDTVTVTFAGQTNVATAAADGRWAISLAPMPASSVPRVLSIASSRSPLATNIQDVLVGDVWLCAGQSNMDMGIGGVNQWWNELPGAPVEGIRLFWVQPNSAFAPAHTVNGNWSVASREALQKKKSPFTTVEFSAIAWFYGRALHRETGIPIGLVECAQGNTAIQAWSTVASLRQSPKFTPDLTTLTGYEHQLATWASASDPAWPETQTWLAPDFSTAAWGTIDLPQDWRQTALPGFKGVVWFRRQVAVPADWAGQPLTLNLGAVPDQTTVWFDQRFIGGQDGTRRGLDGKMIEHVFDVPPEVVTAGDHVVVVRVLGESGLVGEPAHFVLSRSDATGTVALAGAWAYRASTPLSELKGRRRQSDRIWAPGGLYQGMIAPLAPFAIKGAIWYQGEGNAGEPTYGEALTALIRDWRAAFLVGEFPFFIVQLAGFGKLPVEPGESSWAFTREQQARVAREVPNCGLAVAMDRGEIYDIHPPHKRDVGERLAAVALARTYGRDVPCEGPAFRAMQVEGDRVRIAFGHAAGLKSLGGGPAGFAIAGKDRRWVWAQARLEGEAVIVWSPAVPEPVAVRYGWGDNMICNLYNAADFPAVPFRTDDW